MLRGKVFAAIAGIIVLLGGTATAQAAERTFTSENFTITWVDDASHPDAPVLDDPDGDGIPDAVESLAAAFEAARVALVESWGFQEPPVEGRYPVYIGRGDGRGYTQAAAGGEGRSRPSFIVVPPTRLGDGTSSYIPVFAAHEYFHAVQLGLDSGEPDWVKEATATWAQHRFDPSDPDAFGFLRDFVPLSRLPLIWNDGRHEYGAFLFFQFLAERHGPDIVRELWEEMAVPEAIAGAPDRDVFGALETVLAPRGTTLSGEWGIFHLWRRRLAHFERGADYRAALAGSGFKQLLRRDAVRAESCRLTANTETGGGLTSLSGDYVRIDPHRRGPTIASAVLSAAGPPGTAGFYILNRRGAKPEEHILAFDDEGIARADVPFRRGTIKGIVVGLANGGPDGPEATVAYSLQIPGRERTVLSPPGGSSTTTFGTGVMVRGTVLCRKQPAPHAQVVVTERILSTGATRTFETATGVDGSWIVGVTPESRAVYSVELVDPLLSPARQPAQHVVGVRVAVTIAVTPSRPERGTPVSVAGRVQPNHPGAPAVIEYRRPGASTWIAGVETTVDADGNYSAALTLPGDGDWEVRTRVPSTGDDDHLPGTSGVRLVRVT